VAQADDHALEPLPKDLEIRLALSAAPEHWRGSATVYVLDPTAGYQLAKQGDNGSVCVVGRTDWRRPFYSSDILIPICFDREGVEAILPVRFDIEELRAKGAAKEELGATITRNYASGKYRAPRRAGLAPMLSPILIAYTSRDATEPSLLNYPHLMFYAPGVTMAEIGGRQFADPIYPWVLEQGLHGYIIQAMGESERARINESQKDLTDSLCALNKKWCL
jgi:hypothetical protein